MSAAQIRTQLQCLQLERLEVESTALVDCESYMADLEDERAELQEALVYAAVMETLALRCDLGWRTYG
jgi:hypothetical protein